MPNEPVLERVVAYHDWCKKNEEPAPHMALTVIADGKRICLIGEPRRVIDHLASYKSYKLEGIANVATDRVTLKRFCASLRGEGVTPIKLKLE